MTILGIDPGQHGSIAILSNNMQHVMDWPGIENLYHKLRVFIDEIVGLDAMAGSVAYIEKAKPYYGQGIKSGATIMKDYGAWLVLLHYHCERVVEIEPRTWQKTMLGTTKKGETKKISYLSAKTRFPEMEIFLDRPKKRGRGRVILDGRCDALNIAEYGRRMECRIT